MSKIGMFNKSFWAMRQDLKHGNGLAFSIFGGQHVKNTDKQAILDLNTQLQNGVKPGKAWARTMSNCSIAAQEQTRQCLKTKGSLKELANGLNDTSVASKAAEVGMKALSTAGNMLLMWGVSEVVSGLYSLSQVSSEVAEKAQELGESFVNSKSEIDDYKTQIAELYETINSGTSSIEEVTTARQNLMTIQDELIKKFGDEKGSIDLITDAVNGQTNAFDKLSKKQWQETLNKFNDTDLSDKVANLWDGYSTNVDRMLDEYQDYTIDINFGSLVGNWKSDKAKEIFDLLESGGAEISHIKQTGVPVVELSGTADEVHQKLINIQEIFSDENALSTKNFRKQLTSLANSAKDTTDKYKDFYDQYILYEKVLSDSGGQKGYDKSFEKINNAMQSYNDAKLTGDENKIQQAGEKYASILSDELSKVSPQDENVYNYLKNLYPEMQEIVGSWNLEYDLKSSEESKKELRDAFGKFNGTNEIENYNRSTGQNKNKNQAYDSLMKYADKYGLTLDQLIEKGHELGYVQDENYNELVKRFGKENVETLNDKDLEAAYKVPDTTLLSWDELKQKIAKAKNAANEANTSKPKSFTSAWKSLGKADNNDTKQKLLDAADAGELTGAKVKELAKEDEKLKKEFEATGLSADKFAESIRDIHIDDIQGDINECEKALQKMKNGQSLSTEETAKLISENSSLAGSIKKTKDGYKIEEDALISVMNTSKQKYNVVVANEILETNKVIDAVKKRIDAYKSELKAIQTAMEARQMEYDTITDGGTSNDSYGLSPDETSRALLGNPQATQDYSASITIPKKIAKDEKKLKDYQKKLKKLQKSMQKLTGSSGSKKEKNGGTKDSKQTFDWMERRFKNLQNVIDLTASKLQNLFSVKAKNNNLNKQIKTTTKLINEYGIAAKKYQQKADQVAAASTKTVKGKNGKKKKVKTKALSNDIIQKIQTGKFTKKTKLSSLITKYGQSTAERIQSYIDYYDKAQDAKKNKQDQRAKKRELEQQKNQNYVDLYDSRTARAEAKEAIQTNAKDKNKAVDTQLKNAKLSYQYQIKIANLTKNKAEAEKLQYEMEKKVAELKLQQIQNLQDEYDKRVGLIDNDAQDIDNAIALAQARGQTLSAGYYQRLNKQQITKRQEAVNEKSKVEAALAAALKDGSIKKYSDEWYEVQSTLQGLENTINECDVAIAENTTAIRELHTTMLEEMAENANRMNTEADFLANLLSRKDLTDSDTGTFTNAGLGTLGTYGINMETAQAQMRELEKERAILEQMKKTGSLDYGDNGKHKYDSVNQLEDAYKDILDKQQEWTQNEYDAEQKIIDLMKEYYQAQLDYMKEIIDAKKTALDYEKDLYNYQKSLAEKTKSIATLEKQAAALKGDNSEEGRARLSKIQLSLDEANQDLQDTEYDRYINDQQNMLDNMYSEYEDLMNHLFKDTDKLLQEGIEVINKNGELIKSIFDKTAADYSYDYSDSFSEITKAFTASDGIVTGIKDSINGKEDSSISKRLETINTTIETKYNPPSSGDGDKGGGGSGEDPKPPAPTSGGTTQQTQTKNGQTTVTPSAMNKIEGTNEKLKNLRNALNSMKGAGFEKYWTLKSGTPKSYINQRIAAEPNYDKVYPNGKRSPQILTEKGLKLLAKKLGVKYPASGSVKTAELNQYVKDAHFQTGGIVRANGVPLKGDNIPIRVNPNETVLTQDFTDVLPMAVDVMDQFVKAAQPNYNALPNSNACSQSIGDIVIHAELPNVENAQGFVYALQNDSKVQKAFAIATKDLMSKGRITKNIQSVQ